MTVTLVDREPVVGGGGDFEGRAPTLSQSSCSTCITEWKVDAVLVSENFVNLNKPICVNGLSVLKVEITYS